MNKAIEQATYLLETLPESEQNFALEFIQKLVRAWDPDFTKVTPLEKLALEEAERDFESGNTISHDSIDWD